MKHPISSALLLLLAAGAGAGALAATVSVEIPVKEVDLQIDHAGTKHAMWT